MNERPEDIYRREKQRAAAQGKVVLRMMHDRRVAPMTEEQLAEAKRRLDAATAQKTNPRSNMKRMVD